MLSIVLPLLLATSFALQPPGIFHAGEAGAGHAEPWLALQVRDGASSLVATPLTVRAVEDPLIDLPGERSAIEVTSVDPVGVVAYLRGQALRPGVVESARVTVAANAHSAAQPYEIAFRGVTYRIERRCEPQPSKSVDGQAQYDCSMVLRGQDSDHLLARMTGYRERGSAAMSHSDDGMQQLLYAGDLDRDGKLDLIFDTSDHYNLSRPTLFLSSGALDGAPLRAVAHHEATGC